MVVRLAEGKNLVVDSKVPLAAFLEAAESDDRGLPRGAAPGARTASAHPCGPAFREGVLVTAAVDTGVRHPFRPGESFLSAALDVEPVLLEYAAERRVILATPTTLIATLRAAAYAWNQSALTESAQQVFELGRELYERLGTMGDHLGRVGRSLNSAVDAYNSTVGSFERRVFTTARKLRDLHVTEAELTAMEAIEASARPLTAPEFLALDDTPTDPTHRWLPGPVVDKTRREPPPLPGFDTEVG